MTMQLGTDGTNMIVLNPRQPDPIPVRPDLGKRQLEWLEAQHPGIFRNRFIPLRREEQ